MKKRVIFDLDNTLLVGDFSNEVEYFKSIFKEDTEKFLPRIGELLEEYENENIRYNQEKLSEFLKNKTNLKFTTKIINDWIDLVSSIPEKVEEGVFETLEHLKAHDISLAILTNWFSRTQLRRLERNNLLPYFEEIYTGDMVLKPHKIAYFMASGNHRIEDCLFVGDSLDRDYIGPRACGMESILYDKNERYNKSVVKVKRINEIVRK